MTVNGRASSSCDDTVNVSSLKSVISRPLKKCQIALVAVDMKKLTSWVKGRYLKHL